MLKNKHLQRVNHEHLIQVEAAGNKRSFNLGS